MTGKKLLVFIDDLDRCAPESVLDLISAIKHFFIDSDRVVYFCGIDKNSVSRAIDIRYNHIVKSEDYLEKVFDVTFNMPEINDINNLLQDFIKRIEFFNPVPKENLTILKDFLLHIKLTNPRKVKKLFNKYLFLCTLESSNNNRIYKFIPENFNRHEPVQMIFTLFIILLYEFNRGNFETFYNWDIKIAKFKNTVINPESNFYPQSNYQTTFSSYLNELINRWKTQQNLYISNNIIDAFLNTNGVNHQTNRDNRLFELLLLFSPLDTKVYAPSFSSNNSDDIQYQLNSFVNGFQSSNEKHLSSFMSFVLTLFIRPDVSQNSISFNVHDLFKMVNFYL